MSGATLTFRRRHGARHFPRAGKTDDGRYGSVPQELENGIITWVARLRKVREMAGA